MTPLLNQLSLYEAAYSFIHSKADPKEVADQFFPGVWEDGKTGDGKFLTVQSDPGLGKLWRYQDAEIGSPYAHGGQC
jgi:hypothetical protein